MTIDIKICGMTEIDEIKKLEKLNVNHIGFINIKRSKRYVTLDEITSFQDKIVDKQLATLVLEENDAYNVIQKINKTKIYNIQLHSLNKFDSRYIKWSKQYYDFNYVNITQVIGLNNKLQEPKIKEIRDCAIYADNILLDYMNDGLTGGTNKQIPIETAIKASQIIKKTNPQTSVTLAGGLNYNYLESIYDQLHYFDRIDINSGVEYKPGHKKISKIKDIIKLVNET